MIVRKVLNIEDTVLKHIAIARALDKCGVSVVEHAKTGDEGIQMVERSIQENEPYDLIITDMNFPFQGQDDPQAGKKVIMALRERGIDIPAVVCSTHSYREPLAVDNIFYNPRSRDLDWDIREMLEGLKRLK